MESKNQPDVLIQLASILNEQNDYEEILRLVAQKAAGLLNGETATITMLNPRTHETEKTIFKEGLVTNEDQYHILQKQISGWILLNKKAFMSPNIETDSRIRRKKLQATNVTASLGVPLRSEGVNFGTLVVLKTDAGGAIELDVQYLEKLATIASPYLRNTQKVQQYFKTSLPQTALLKKYEAIGLLGRSRKFIELLKATEAAARCDVRVLLEGNTGTGKELIARAIHQFSTRCDHHFVAIDCGAIPDNLIESELFGHAKGAFTGATTDRKGLFEEANCGTLFMDEIANLPIDVQAKLMRVLQEGEVRPLGANKTSKVDVRIISASSVPLSKLVDSQQFREDLFFRLYVYPILVPGLDERQEDIPLLGNHFLKKFALQQKKKVDAFHEEILNFMKVRHWAGNIRELENFAERLVTLASSDSKLISRDTLPQELKRELKKYDMTLQDYEISKSLNESISEYEEQLIRQALIANQWNQSQTARVLKISEQTLRYKMGKLRIIRQKF